MTNNTAALEEFDRFCRFIDGLHMHATFVENDFMSKGVQKLIRSALADHKSLERVAAQMAEALEKAKDELVTEIAEIGGCDHSIGMCCCPLKNAAERADKALTAYNALKGNQND